MIKINNIKNLELEAAAHGESHHGSNEYDEVSNWSPITHFKTKEN